MKLRFTPDAVRDLEDLKAWLVPRSRSGHRKVVGAIQASLRHIQAYPQSGRVTEHPRIREAVEVRYGFIIPYTTREDAIWVLRVYHARRHPLIWTDDGLE